jgi:hypothetical protein
MKTVVVEPVELVTANALHHSLVQRPSCATSVGGNPVQQILDDFLVLNVVC